MAVGDRPKTIDNTIGTFEYHIKQGLEEADAFNDRKVACKMKMMLIQNSIRCGEDVDKIIVDLKVLNHVLMK